MDVRRDSEMPKEKRSLLNAGHGPPIRQDLPLTYGFYGNSTYTPTAPVFHRNATCSDFGSLVLTSPGFYRGYRYHPTFMNGREIDDDPILVQNIKENVQQLQLSNGSHLMQAGSEKKVFDDLVRERDELQWQLAAKTKELKSLEREHIHVFERYQHLTEKLTALPDVPTRLPGTSAPDDFIHLIPSEELACGDNMTSREQNLDDQAAMMKSVQCSEPSMEQVTDGKEGIKETEIASPIIGKKCGEVSSSSSSASFEVVGQGSCLASPVERENMKIPSLSVNAELVALRSKYDELSRKLEAEKDERKREIAELKERLDQKSEREEKNNGKALEVRPADWQLEVRPTERQSEEQRQSVSELMSANWKLTEHNVELTRENEDLKKKELDWRSAVSNVNKLQDEVLREQRRARDAEELLEAQRQHILELESRSREMEHMRLAESSEQKGMAHSGAAGDLTTENAVLRHQIEAYKEDFEVERKDREKLVAQKDTLQRGFDTLRYDLDVARQQLKKYEDDITLLRIDNNTLRTRLRSVTEELDALKEGHQFATSKPKASSPPAQNRTLVPKPVPQNTFAQQKPSPPPSGQSGDWECQACTFKNPAPRTFCEMCGTHEPLRISSAAQVPNCTYVPNIPVRELPPVQWNVAQAATPLLSNLRNYGDIETD